jgi:hypothetical protein
MNILILAISITIWVSKNNFMPEVFLIGFVGSTINILAIICCQNAISKGPIGPVLAILALASVTFVI